MIRLLAAASSGPRGDYISLRMVLIVVLVVAFLVTVVGRSGGARGRAFATFGLMAFGALLFAGIFLRPVSVQVSPEAPSAPASFADLQSVNEPLSHPTVYPISTEPPRPISAELDVPRGSQAEDDETVWLPVGKETLAKLFGEEHLDDIASLSEELSKHSETAYALIPVSEAQPAPVIRHVLTPTPFRELLTPQNLQLIASALEGYASNIEEESINPTLGETPSLASWISQRPGLGQTVVRTEKFHESTIPPEEALRPAIMQALKERITELASDEFSIGRDWNKLVEVSLSDRALRECILRTDRKVSEIETVEGTTVMQQTFALVQFPEEAEEQIVEVIRERLIQSRSMAVALSLGALWLGTVLLAIACRISQTGSFLKRWTTGPLFAAAAVPCLLAFLLLLVAMSEGHTFELFNGDGRVAYVMDSHD